MEYREERRRRGVFYGWWLVALAGVVMVAVTVPWSPRTMPIWALAMAYESSRAVVGRELEWPLYILIIGGLLLGPVVGYLADRVIGIRRMVVAGLIILSGAFLFFSQTQNLWMYYAASGLMAVGVTMFGFFKGLTGFIGGLAGLVYYTQGSIVGFLTLSGLTLLGAFFFLGARAPQARDTAGSQAAPG